jgi:hypothetical protein
LLVRSSLGSGSGSVVQFCIGKTNNTLHREQRAMDRT